LVTFFLLTRQAAAIVLPASSRHRERAVRLLSDSSPESRYEKKEMIMKLKLAIALGWILVTGIAVHGQALGIRVSVPFNFYVAGKVFPSGEYTVSAIRDSVVLRDNRGNRVAMALSNSIRRTGGDTGQVVFDCYTGGCYLSQLRTPDPDSSRELLRGKDENELARHEAAKPFVLLGSVAK
jgi:hypothetical protein